MGTHSRSQAHWRDVHVRRARVILCWWSLCSSASHRTAHSRPHDCQCRYIQPIFHTARSDHGLLGDHSKHSSRTWKLHLAHHAWRERCCLPQVESLFVLSLDWRRTIHALFACRGWLRYWLDFLHPVFNNDHNRGSDPSSDRRFYSWILIYLHGSELHRHGAQASTAGNDVVPNASFLVGALCNGDHSGSCNSSARNHCLSADC